MGTENEPRDPEQQASDSPDEGQIDPMAEDFVDEDLDQVSEADDRINSAEGPI